MAERRGPSGSSGSPLVHLELIAVQLFFASFSVAGKIALRELPAVELAAIRVTLATAVFAIVWLAVGRERVSAGDLGRCALYAFFGVAANQLLFVGGLARTTATTAVVLGSSIPVFTVAVALVLGRERATALKLAGLAVALAGALGITSAGRFEAGGHALVGNAMIVVNSLCYAVYLVLSRDLLARLAPLTVMTLTFAFGTLMIDGFLVGAGALGLLGYDPVATTAAAPALSRATWLAIAWIVAFPSVGAYLLNALALRVVPASLVAIYVYLQPVLGAALAAVILHERPTASTSLGALCIFAGIWLVGMDARRRRPRPTAVTS